MVHGQSKVSPGPRSLATVLYRWLARILGRHLGKFEFVESVFVRRSVASGEVSFGRSDIDLTVIIDRPLLSEPDILRLLELWRTVRNLRLCVPLLGEIGVCTRQEHEQLVQVDPYRASLNRRAAHVVYGPPVEIAALPIRPGHAARELAYWFGNYLPRAVRQRDGRNLRKFALEMCNAYLTATGTISEPCLTRAETESVWAAKGPGFPRGWDRKLRNTLTFCYEIGHALHARLRPRLASLRHPLIFRAPLPPGYRMTTFVVLPGPAHPVPAEAAARDAFVSTPEVLDLYLQYLNAFAGWALPPELPALGIESHSPGMFLRACRYYGVPYRWRFPGFNTKDTALPIRAVPTIRHALGGLKAGEVSRPKDYAAIARLEARPPSYIDYYRRYYAPLYRQVESLWSTGASPLCEDME